MSSSLALGTVLCHMAGAIQVGGGNRDLEVKR